MYSCCGVCIQQHLRDFQLNQGTFQKVMDTCCHVCRPSRLPFDNLRPSFCHLRAQNWPLTLSLSHVITAQTGFLADFIVIYIQTGCRQPSPQSQDAFALKLSPVHPFSGLAIKNYHCQRSIEFMIQSTFFLVSWVTRCFWCHYFWQCEIAASAVMHGSVC